MKIHNKLVRDRIPEIITANGETPHYHMVHGEELVHLLFTKLVEEAQEVAEARGNQEEVMKELADVQEVMESLVNELGLLDEEIEQLKLQRREERGGFATGTFLESTE
jgi:predicted house-cleaning noncanonical NTP pyrophosphatase (MazG superfamily)